MPGFDVQAAKQQGYSDDDILKHLTETRNFDIEGAVKSGYSKADIITHLSTQPAPAGSLSLLDQAKDFGQHLIVDPIAGALGAVKRMATPPQTLGEGAAAAIMGPAGPLVVDMVRGNIQAGKNAVAAGKKGDVKGAVIQGLGAIPVVGPLLSQVATEVDNGQYGAAAGDVGGIFLPTPKALKGAKARTVGKFVNPNAVEREAVAFGRANGIPVSAATSTGNKFVAGTQAILDHSPAGSIVAQRAKQAETAAFTRVGRDIADQVHPAAYSPESAGASVTKAGDDLIHTLKKEADAAYGDFRKSAKDPANAVAIPTGPAKQVPTGVLDAQGNPIMRTVAGPAKDVALPVDVSALKAKAAEQLEQMSWMPVADRNSSAGYTALKKIVEGPDVISAVEAEHGLSGLKTLAREAQSPDLRNVSQGIGADIGGELQGLIDQAAAKAGPKVLQDLQAGRAAHAHKMGVAEVMQKMREEPVQLFNQATYSQDAGINQIRAVAKVAPQEMPKLGRAYIEKMLDTATAEGGFDKALGLWSKWQNLGPETKKILFKNPMLIKDLDNFFLLAKKAAENPNPSGSALVGSIAAGFGYLLKNPISGVVMNIPAGAVAAMLHSPAGVEALSKGLTIPVGKGAASTIAATRILKLAGDKAKPLQQAAENNLPEQTDPPALAAAR